VNRVTENENQIPSLYEWLGGAEVQNASMVKFYERVSADELLRPLFGDMPADHPRHVADFVGEVLGGSQAYTVSGGVGKPAAGQRG
jgi:hemoglobin